MSYASEVLTDSPVSYYRVNEVSGTVALDSSGNGRHGTYIDTITFGLTSYGAPLGTAIDLGDGGNFGQGSITIPTSAFNPGSGSWTIEGWILVEADLTSFWTPQLFNADDGTAFINITVLNNGYPSGPYVNVNTYLGQINSSTIPTNDLAWHHLVITYDAGAEIGTIYWDGALFGTASFPPNPFSTFSTTLAIGSSDSFAGQVDEFAFYHSALTAGRVAAHYAAATSSGGPTVTSVTPTSGSIEGNTTVTIAGTGFTDATAVAFGATPALSYVVDSDISITARSPAHASGLVNVTVTNTGGTSATGAGNQFTYIVLPPTVTHVSPVDPATAGGTNVLVVGTNFVSVSDVKFGTTSATSFVVSSVTQLTAVAPAHSAGTVDVTVITGVGASPVDPSDQVTYGTPSSPVDPSFARWVLYDPVALTSAIFEFNPSDGDAPAKNRTVAIRSRRAPGHKTVVIINSYGQREFTFSGTILTQSMYDLFVTWFNKTNPINLTDDLGRTFTIYFTKFIPRRVRKTYNPWFHTYEVTGTIL